MSQAAPPPLPESDRPPTDEPVPALKKSAWNLLLFLPLLVLITPIYNRESPHLFGLPMYYWFQFACVPLGVVAVAVVFVKTRHH